MAEQGSAGGDLHLGNALSKGEAHVGKEELEKDKDVEGGMASDVAVGKGRGQGAPAVGGSKAAGRDIPEEASAQSKSSQGGVSVAHFFLKKRPSSVGNGATREAKGADDEGLRSEVAVGKDDVYMDLSGDSASKGLVACGKGGKGDAERSGDGGVGGKGGVGGGKGGVERSGGLPGNDGRNTLQRPHKLRRHNAAVHTHPVCGGVQGGGEEGDESGAGVKQHASESVALPAVEHQADLKQFVLRLHDLPGRSQTGGGLEERAGEDADVVDDQARLTYVLRKRKGQQVHVRLRVFMCAFVHLSVMLFPCCNCLVPFSPASFHCGMSDTGDGHEPYLHATEHARSWHRGGAMAQTHTPCDTNEITRFRV
jgi:hypothetical protein